MSMFALAAEDVVCSGAHPRHLLFHTWALPWCAGFAALAGAELQLSHKEVMAVVSASTAPQKHWWCFSHVKGMEGTS